MNDKDSVGVLIELKSKDSTKSIIQTKNETESFEKSIKSLGNEIKKAFNSSPIIGWTSLIVKATKSMINAAKSQIDYIENLNLMNVAFGETDRSGQELINTLSNIGYDPAGLTKSLGTYRQIASALGLASEQASLLSKNLLQMQLDIGSLYNLSNDAASSKLISAITGEARAVKILGADLTQAGLQQTAYNLGINESVKNMSQAEKTILRYITLEKQLVNSQGDLKRTAESTSNQVRILKEQISMLGRQIGGFFIPILDAILPYLNGILMVITTIIDVIQTALGISPINLASVFGFGKSDISGYSSAWDDYSNSVANAQKSLRGFDKLNVITTPKESDSGGVGGGISSGMLKAIDEYNSKISEIQTKAMRIKESILKFLGFEKDDQGNWKFAKITLGTIIGGLGLLLLVGLALAPVFKIFKKIFGLFTKNKSVTDTAKSVGGLSDGFKSLFKSIGFAVGAIALLGGLALVIKEITKLIDTFSKSGLTLGEVAGLLGIVLGEVTLAFVALAAASKLFSITGVLGMVAALGGLVLILKEVNKFFEIITDTGLTLGEVAGFLGIVLGEVIVAIGLLTAAAIILGSNPLALIAVVALAGSLYIVLKAINDFLPTILDCTLNFINKVGPAINRLVDNIISAITKIVNFLISAIEYMINTLVISSVNSFIKKINKLIPGSSLDLNTVGKVSISRFRPQLYDKGGFPEKGTMFIAGEKRAEMVGNINGRTAVANNDQIVEAISVGVAKAMMATNKSTNVTIEATGDTKGLLDFIEFKQKAKNRQYGM